MLYDLIPVKLPEMLGQPTSYYANYFLKYSRRMQPYIVHFGVHPPRSDGIRCADRPSGTARRGSAAWGEYPGRTECRGVSDGGLRDRLARRRFALSVGTFEIRKNYKLLIDLWHELVDDSKFDLDLVIVGMAGWCVEDVLAQLRLSPLFGDRIFWFQGISDAALSWLYDTCHVFLFPSLYEGWGLPVVEALQHGRPAIVSNRGAVPEAGLGIAQIIDPDDRQAWLRAIAAEAQSPRRRVVAPSIPNWDYTADVVKQHLSRTPQRYGDRWLTRVLQLLPFPSERPRDGGQIRAHQTGKVLEAAGVTVIRCPIYRAAWHTNSKYQPPIINLDEATVPPRYQHIWQLYDLTNGEVLANDARCFAAFGEFVEQPNRTC